MRYAKGHKEETRQAILEKASERFRRDGINAVGIKSLMSDAGLTHGGFYAHFSSRESLVAEAAEEALKRTLALLRDISSNADGDRKLEAFVNGYLSPQHYEDMAFGCAGAALAPEIAREGEDTRRRFTAGIERIVEYISELLPPGGGAEQRLEKAHAIFSLMMGAVQLARVTVDQKLAARIIEGARSGALSLSHAGWGE